IGDGVNEPFARRVVGSEIDRDRGSRSNRTGYLDIKRDFAIGQSISEVVLSPIHRHDLDVGHRQPQVAEESMQVLWPEPTTQLYDANALTLAIDIGREVVETCHLAWIKGGRLRVARRVVGTTTKVGPCERPIIEAKDTDDDVPQINRNLHWASAPT